MTTVAAHRAAMRHVVAQLIAVVTVAVEVALPSPSAFAQLAGGAAAGVAAGKGEQEEREERGVHRETMQGNRGSQRAQLQTVTLSEQVSMKKSLARASSTST